MLTNDANKRLSIDQVLQDKWFSWLNGANSASLNKKTVNVIQNLVNYERSNDISEELMNHFVIKTLPDNEISS